jgi:hypothetical protein
VTPSTQPQRDALNRLNCGHFPPDRISASALPSLVGVGVNTFVRKSLRSGLQFGDLNSDIKAPNFLNYNASAIVTAARRLPVPDDQVERRRAGAGGLILNVQ